MAPTGNNKKQGKGKANGNNNNNKKQGKGGNGKNQASQPKTEPKKAPIARC